jgi:probable phosphoglycerate mutase
MTMLSLYLVRHGQTEYSLNNRFCGAIDPPLNEHGLAMAEALGARYGREPWAGIWCSPQMRARQTAQPTATRAGKELILDDGLREIGYGEWEGRPEEEVARTDAARFAAWSGHPGHFAPPGGESGLAIAARVVAAVERIKQAHASGKVLIVSHKATLRVLACALLGVDVDLFRARIAQKVCAISIIELKSSGPLLQVLGDTSHLPPDLCTDEGT